MGDILRKCDVNPSESFPILGEQSTFAQTHHEYLLGSSVTGTENLVMLMLTIDVVQTHNSVAFHFCLCLEELKVLYAQ